MIRIFVGDVNEYLSIQAKNLYGDATLLTGESAERKLPSGNYYTSLGDFVGYRQFMDALDQANELYYTPPEIWSNADLKKWTIQSLCYFLNRKPVYNSSALLSPQDMDRYLQLKETRKSAESQIWVCGGSDTLGIGVEAHETYAHKIGLFLQRPVSLLAEIGASVEWISDQICRSDIKKNDIVIFGMVPPTRLAYHDGSKLRHVAVESFARQPDLLKTIPLDMLDDFNTTCYRPITALRRVINYCDKIQANFLIAGLDPGLDKYFSDQSFYINLWARWGLNPDDIFIDFGNDKSHPGPMHHAWVCDEIIARIKHLGWKV